MFASDLVLGGDPLLSLQSISLVVEQQANNQAMNPSHKRNRVKPLI